ncbi:hypothetical protein [Bradyrhizobium sp. NP1]|uniref:hypothetical protein n=1 Tax=Bradyrhizobium sp. NP1 TaxID=3049772 RepID=UPI0025A59543|nr:hypothetical protein [Bradyrhizobium sp. NP1]WJR81399.1 hypothetical protein QOU61_17100 [Bradyrhizobium sp. NP1]
MTSRIAALVVILPLATATPGLGQQAEEFADSTLTREQWQQRVEKARRQSEEFVANMCAQPAVPLAPEEKEKEAADRAINDPTLQHGDIVITNKGFVVFTGRSEQHEPGDFQQAPNPPPRP